LGSVILENEKYTFEADGIEVEFKDKIPLWLFGFIY